eukprot:2804321-Rhodomonas_salina.7
MDSKGVCHTCNDGAYCIDGMMLMCPFRATYQHNNHHKTHGILGCVCDDGFILNTLTYTCDECGNYHYCSNGTKLACPLLSHTSTSTATDISQCVCTLGQFMTDTDCVNCEATAYCPDGIRFYNTRMYEPACERCHADHYCTAGEMIRCPPASWAMQGAESVSDCICETHFAETALAATLS